MTHMCASQGKNSLSRIIRGKQRFIKNPDFVLIPMFPNEVLRDDNTSPCKQVGGTLPVCSRATAGSPHPVRPFSWAIAEQYALSTDDVLSWRGAWCAYRNAYNHEEPAVPNEELAQYARESPFNVQHIRMAGKYAESMGNYHKAYASDRSSNPLDLTDASLRDFTLAMAKDDKAGILRAFEYAGWDTKE